MKKIICAMIAICIVVGLTGCGNGAQEAASVDLEAVYDGYQQYLPEMFFPDEATLLNFLGIRTEDCAQYKIAICSEGMRADEIWLIEAKGDAAMETLTALAQTRIQAKLDETESYVPDQFQIVQKAEVLTNGRYLALLISPDVDTLKAGFEAAFQ